MGNEPIKGHSFRKSWEYVEWDDDDDDDDDDDSFNNTNHIGSPDFVDILLQ